MHNKKILAVAALLSAPLFANAAMITQMGADVSFTYDDSTLYGTGFVVGNSIFFSPTTFIAESLNTAGAVSATATLNIDVEVHQGSNYVIDSFQIAEAGDYLLNGASSSVSAEGRLQVTSLTSTCGGLFPCQDTDIFSAGALTTVGALTEWTASGAVDFDDIAGWGTDTHVQAQIQNLLTATSTVDGESAFIQKKFEGVGLVVMPEVPVPAAAWLFGSALLGLAGVKRKK
jgi:hypothetical protein